VDVHDCSPALLVIVTQLVTHLVSATLPGNRSQLAIDQTVAQPTGEEDCVAMTLRPRGLPA
jgi:hypothetical protein